MKYGAMNLQYVLFLVVAFLIGTLLLEPKFVAPWLNIWLNWLGGLREGLGEALIIAVILAVGVDRYVKNRLLTEVTRDALSFLAGHNMPDKLKRLIEDLWRCQYVRNKFEIHFVLEDINIPNFVRLRMTTTYTVWNLTEERVDYKVQTSLEKPRWEHYGSSALEEIVVSGSDDFKITYEEIQKDHQHDTSDYIIFERNVKLLPAAKQTPLKVKTVRSAVYPDTWYYVLDLLEPTMGIKIYTNPQKKFNWDVHFFHGREASNHRVDFWEHRTAYLPGQSARVIWDRVSP